MTKDELQAIKARCEAATPGEWKISEDCNNSQMYVFDTVGIVCKTYSYGYEYPEQSDNMTFIAHARTDIPALLAYVGELETENKEMLDTGGKLAKELIESEADRDKWQARAEALERAVKTKFNACRCCIHAEKTVLEEPCWNCAGHDFWQFDQARFAGGAGEDEKS